MAGNDCGLFQGIIPEFIINALKKIMKTLVRIASALTETQT